MVHRRIPYGKGSVRRMNIPNILFLLGRGRSQTGGYGGWVWQRKFNSLKKKVAGKQKGGSSFHDDIFS